MKKNKLTEKRMLIGLIALLFVVTFVHTISILDISEEVSTVPADSQKAQVATLSICLQITPAYNMVSSNETNDPAGYVFVHTDMYWNIKNVCTSNAWIVNSGSVGSYNAPTTVSLQTRHSNGSLLSVLPSNFSTYNLAPYFADSTSCINCGTSGYVQYPSNASTVGQWFVDAYKIPPNTTRMILMSSAYKREGDSDWPIRVLPKAIKWITQSSVNDNYISPTDILTTPIPAAEAGYWATDFNKPYIQ